MTNTCTPVCDGCPSNGDAAIPVSNDGVDAIVNAYADLAAHVAPTDEQRAVIDDLRIALDAVMGSTISAEGIVALDSAAADLELMAGEERAHVLVRRALIEIPAICRRRVLAAAMPRYETRVNADVTQAARALFAAHKAFSEASKALEAAAREHCTTCANAPGASKSLGGSPALCQWCATCGPDHYRAIPSTPRRRAPKVERPTVQMSHEQAMQDPPDDLFGSDSDRVCGTVCDAEVEASGQVAGCCTADAWSHLGEVAA